MFLDYENGGGAEQKDIIFDLINYLKHNLFRSKLLSVAPITHNSSSSYILKVDSGASSHIIKSQHKNLLDYRQKTPNGPTAILPNNKRISATEQGLLPLTNNLPSSAKTAHIYPDITNESLLSIGQLCNADCTAIFTKYFLKIFYNNKLILKGYRNPTDNLWMKVPLKYCYLRIVTLCMESMQIF